MQQDNTSETFVALIANTLTIENNKNPNNLILWI